ncbi:MAG: hypothetical protein ACKVOY_04955 [Burkholderiaceae bacterium]
MLSTDLTFARPIAPSGNLQQGPLLLRRYYKNAVIVDWVESVRWMTLHETHAITLCQQLLVHVSKRIVTKNQGDMIKSLGDGFLLVLTPLQMRSTQVFKFNN